MHHFTGFFGLLASCVLLVVAPQTASANGKSKLVISAPKPAPTIVYRNGGQETLHFEPGKAKLTAVHFWATWCAPCLTEIAEVNETAATYKDRGLVVMPLSLDADHKKVEAFLAARHLTALPPLQDADTDSFQATRSPGLPTTLFINEKGEEIARAQEVLNWKNKEVTDFIEAQLK